MLPPRGPLWYPRSMDTRVEELLRLPVGERAKIAQLIWDSVVEESDELPLAEHDRAELDRRLAAYEQSPSGGSPWEEVKARILGRG